LNFLLSSKSTETKATPVKLEWSVRASSIALEDPLRFYLASFIFSLSSSCIAAYNSAIMVSLSISFF
jgi:hypothetical protein